MAIRRYKLAIDNHPAAGYATEPNIQGSGELFLELGWRPQAVTVSLAKQYITPAEYIPSSGATLYILAQDAPNSQTYDILETTSLSVPGPATTIAASNYTSVFYTDAMNEFYYINPNCWNMLSVVSIAEADKISFDVKDFTAIPNLLLIKDSNNVVSGDLLYCGFGTDVSAGEGLPALTKFEIMGGITDLTEIAEMIFVQGQQVVGDIYDYQYSYGTGAYDLTIVNNILYIQFNSALDPDWPYFFFIFGRAPQPELRVRYESDPFEDNGVWLVYNNLPKGTLKFNYYVR